MKIAGKRFGILGIARSGISAARKIKALGGEVFLSELKSDIPEKNQIQKKFPCEFGGHTEKILENEYLVVSPGIPLNIPIIKKAKAKKIKIISEIELGFLIKHPNSKIIAVTGSNGKSTTVSLIYHILQRNGFKSILAGNIGSAFTSYPIEKPGIDLIVLELSSFQLELIASFKADIAILLNISPDHLDRYASLEKYAAAKFNIFRNQTKKDIAILNADDPFCRKKIADLNAQIKLFSQNSTNNKGNDFFENPVSQKILPLPGPHNLMNMNAAILTTEEFITDHEKILSALKTFRPLPHRLEFVKEIKRRRFYNDSKATNTESVKFALNSFSAPIRLILGGLGKGEDYSVLLPVIQKHAAKLYLIGKEAKAMEKIFSNQIDLAIYPSLETAVKTAFSESQENDVILLSPACASFDMFENYQQRGNHFKEIVENLQ